MGRRLVMAAAIVGGALVVAPGVASAHVSDVDTDSACVDGGWTASVTIEFSADPGNVSGTVTSTFHGSADFVLPPETPMTFFAGQVIPLSEPSVTFSFEGEWDDDTPVDEPPVTVTQPGDCTETTTTTSEPPTTTTTVPDTTTTTVPGATTTTAPAALSITAITPVCVRDAPYVRVTFGDQAEFNGDPATVTFIDLDGNTVGTHTATYAANGSVTFVYPGASVDAAGNPTDWPGWVFDGDEWVPDPTDDRLRDGLTVRVEVNPTATGQVSYPPATSACANPPTSSQTSGTLPTTGRATGGMGWAAGAVLLLGLGALALSRRRTV